VPYGTWSRGRELRSDAEAEQSRLLGELMRVGWGGSIPAFRQVFSSLYMPSAGERERRWADELQQASSTGEVAARLWQSRGHTDITGVAPRLTQPALVLHARNDRVVPHEEGRRLASLLPDARFVTLESENHILQEGEPACEAFLAEVRAFLGGGDGAAAMPAEMEELSAREREVLELVATGMSNEEIAERLFLSSRTVERHLSNVYAKLRLSGKAARAAAAARFSRM
jgi:DNA-binding CsgD family transcriptional regulator